MNIRYRLVIWQELGGPGHAPKVFNGKEVPGVDAKQKSSTFNLIVRVIFYRPTTIVTCSTEIDKLQL